MIKSSTIEYYAVQIEEYKEQIHQYPGALYKKFYTKWQAEDYINEENYDEANILKVWTDGYCENNDKKNALASIAELYAAICALEKVNNEQDMIVLNDLIKKRKGKSIFKHVKGHSGIYENE
ncbi:19101_t:CDS:2 [Gigaspora margarita]|uniref:19101_t:CDS:1 n=1 Tax=Gigaspora margarita TaxID=4874 RepID=A0ABN7VBM2_GIGMA|nr:19101_t:CDS:2 [Gigaspora margarita]